MSTLLMQIPEPMPESIIPRLKNGVELFPFDASYTEPKFLVVMDDARFEVSLAYYELLKLIDGKRSLQQITNEYARAVKRDVTEPMVREMLERTFIPQGIVSFNDRFVSVERKRSYLHYRTRIVPNWLLKPVAGYFKALFSPMFFIPLIILIILSEIYFYAKVDLPAIAQNFFIGDDIVIGFVILFASLLLHELGHISACEYYGAEYTGIGIGLYFYFPAFYSEINGAWKLSKKQRAMVDFAGVYCQFLFIPLLLVLFMLTENKSIITVISLLNVSILTNMNPFIKLDGYWLASDLLGLPNLRKKSTDVFKHLFSARRKKPGESLTSMNGINDKTLYLLVLYSFICNIFFIYFAYSMVFAFYNALLSYKAISLQFIDSFSRGLPAIMRSFSRVFFINVILLTCVLFVYRKVAQIFRKRVG